MARDGQSKQDTSANQRSGGGQTIVELREVTDTGLEFWTRQRFEIGAELQVRLHRDAMPGLAQGSDEWLMIRGFVVGCQPVRQADGTPGFRVSLLLDSALMQPEKHRVSPPPMRYLPTRFRGLMRMGYN